MLNGNNIFIDSRMIDSSGIGTYLRNVIPSILSQNDTYHYMLLGDIIRLNQIFSELTNNLELKELRSAIYTISEQLELKRILSDKCTLFWSPHYNIPLSIKGKLIVTVHDVFHLALPQLVGGMHKRYYAKIMFNIVRRKANAILCDSYFTKHELERLTSKGSPGQLIETVYLGIDKIWFSVRKEASPHPRPYLLFVGNVKPHKNLGRLLEAFSRITGLISQDLVIVGKKEGFITKDRVIEVKSRQLNDRVFFTGYVSDFDLRQFYAHADALVLPSLYEGFGLPPLEAMACGTPAIVSKVASLPEVCSDAALYFNPYDPDDISQKIIDLLSNQGLRANLTQKGYDQARKYTWEKCAKETCSVIEKVLTNENRFCT
jgi:glycosyltransferase involved in cell wall biosynthesis